jgi:hypothetical protein
MKLRHVGYAFGFVLGLALVGCVDEPRLGSNADGVTWQEFRAAVYQEPGTGMFIVDWDRPIRGEAALFDFWSSLQPGALTIYNTGSDVKWNATQKKQLTYCISNTFGTNKTAVISAMTQATENGWEKMADVDFTYVPAQDANCTASNTNVLFDVNPVNSNGQYLARSFFPDNARTDRNVLIDTNAFDPQQTGGIPLGNILGHELGHVLGFRHEHIRPEANAAQCAEDTQYRAVTAYDSASVMHYPQCNGTSTTLAFTQRDREGVVLIYGAPVVNMPPMAQVVAPQDGATVAPTFTVSTSIVDSDIARVELHIDGALRTTSTTAPYTFEVTSLAAGPHVLEIDAFDAANQAVSTTVNVTVRTSGGTGGTDPGGDGNDADGDGRADVITGGCSSGGSSGGGGVPLAFLFVLVSTRVSRRARGNAPCARRDQP